MQNHILEKILFSIDCVILSFMEGRIRVLLTRYPKELNEELWALPGDHLTNSEDLSEAASRILTVLTGANAKHQEFFGVFSNPLRVPRERSISLAYFSLINPSIIDNEAPLAAGCEWFPLHELPKTIFDHHDIIDTAKEHIRQRAFQQPILFSLVPEKFTMRQIQDVYENMYDKTFDNRNFYRKILSGDFLQKEKEKDKQTSKKGSFLYSLNKDDNAMHKRRDIYLNIL